MFTNWKQYISLYMKILVMRTLYYYSDRYPIAEKSLLSWANEFSKIRFNNFNEVKQLYKNSSVVGNRRVIFHIKGNDFRLIVSMNFIQQACYIIWFGTHKEYDRINVETIDFDKDINTFKRK